MSVDMGIDAQTNSRGTLRPYVGVGVGAGAISIREMLPTVNTHVGVAMGARRGAQLHLEVRVQRNFQTIYRTRSMLSAGVGVGW